MKYPSIKNIVLILIAAVVVAGAFFLAEYKNKQKKQAVYTASATASTTLDLSPILENSDSDNDGLKDWEEILLGTNPRKSDTDGDGTTDGKEASSGRNPLVKGPNDKASSSNSKTSKSEPLTPTDLMARDFFSRYMELRQAGLSGDAQSREEMINKVLSSGIVISAPKIYSTKDILIKQDNSTESIKKYGNDVAMVFKNNSIQSRNEGVIMKESIDKDDPEILKEMDPIISSYKKILNGLLKIQTPQTFSNQHLLVINSMNKVLFVAELMRKSDKDAVSGIQGVSMYLAVAKEFNDSFFDLKDYISKFGIIYGNNEIGAIFNKIQ